MQLNVYCSRTKDGCDRIEAWSTVCRRLGGLVSVRPRITRIEW